MISRSSLYLRLIIESVEIGQSYRTKISDTDLSFLKVFREEVPVDYYVQNYNISGYNIMIQIFSKFSDQLRSSHLSEQCGPTYRTLTMYNSLKTYIYPCKHAFFWCIKRCAITCFGFSLLLTFSAI